MEEEYVGHDAVCAHWMWKIIYVCGWLAFLCELCIVCVMGLQIWVCVCCWLAKHDIQLCGVSGSLTEYIIETFCLFLYVLSLSATNHHTDDVCVRCALLFTYGATESLNKYLKGLRYFLCRSSSVVCSSLTAIYPCLGLGSEFTPRE